MKRILFLFFASSALCSPAVAQHAQHYLQVQGDSAGASTRFVTDTGLVPTAHGLYGVVPLANGGTGPWLSGDVNRVFTSNGTSAPSWQAGGGGAAPVIDSLVGDTGTIPAPSSFNLQLTILKPVSTGNYTLAPPTYGMNGYRLFFFTVANDTVVVTCSNGFNGKGSSGTITTYGFAGDGAVLIAWGGSWFISPKNITIQ